MAYGYRRYSRYGSRRGGYGRRRRYPSYNASSRGRYGRRRTFRRYYVGGRRF